MKKIFASLTLVLLAPAFAQDAVAFKLDDVTLRPIKFNEFVAQVKESNAWVRSKKLSNESTASWQQSMSAYNLNPSFSYSRGTFYAAAPMESYRTPQSGTFTLSGNIEGRGKQDARKEFSGAEVIRQWQLRLREQPDDRLLVAALGSRGDWDRQCEDLLRA